MAKNRKHIEDKFYTKPSTARFCISLIDTSQYNTIIEPSAGNGSFSSILPNCISFDISPDHPSIKKTDYLQFTEFDYDLISPVLVIGNPPFGNQSCLAFKFINHSMFADTVAFILPKSFKKPSFQDRIYPYFHLRLSVDIPNNSFTLNDIDYNIPCVFQIWDKKSIKRELSNKLNPLSFQFVKKDENPNITIRRCGVNAGKLFLDSNRSEQSHYFIKTKDKEQFIKKWNSIKWTHDNTAGCPSISKQEIIKCIDFS